MGRLMEFRFFDTTKYITLKVNDNIEYENDNVLMVLRQFGYGTHKSYYKLNYYKCNGKLKKVTKKICTKDGVTKEKFYEIIFLKSIGLSEHVTYDDKIYDVYEEPKYKTIGKIEKLSDMMVKFSN